MRRINCSTAGLIFVLFIFRPRLCLCSGQQAEACHHHDNRLDCGWVGITEGECSERRCCWNPAPDVSATSSDSWTSGRPHGTHGQAQTNTPWCFHPTTFGETIEYSMGGIVTTETGVHAILALKTEGKPTLGASIKTLHFQSTYYTCSTLRVTIDVPPDSPPRWKIPHDLLPGLASPLHRSPCRGSEYTEALLTNPITKPSTLPRALLTAQEPAYQNVNTSHDALNDTSILRDYTLAYTRSPFSFAVHRRERPITGSHSQKGTAPLFNLTTFAFKDQYLEVTTPVPKSSSLLGLGEQSRRGVLLPRDGSIVTLWNRDAASSNVGSNLYGSHPFLVEIRADGRANGLFLANSNGMDVLIHPESVQFRVIGGIVDLFFFTGPSLEDVVKQYQQVVGKPAMMPTWALGFHQSRWGYKDVEELRTVVKNYRDARIPLDAIWSDIDHMDGYKDFTLQPERYSAPKMRSFLDQLHANHQRWVPIIDPGIKKDPGYPAYDQGLKDDIFLKDMYGKPYIGKVWPGDVHYPDFLNPASDAYWYRQLQGFHDLAAWDGLWIDMNEPSNFANTQMSSSSNVSRPDNSFEDPPYRIGNGYGDLDTKTVSVTARHYHGGREYNTHNLFSLMEAHSTHHAVASITLKRPFILTRSTFSGSGTYSAHWTGDNSATWTDLQLSISKCLTFNILSIPMVGADICGFNGDTNVELCARWIAAGAFYTFARSHSSINAMPQELYRWPQVAQAAKNALSMRYQLLPLLNTLLAQAHLSGGTVMRPLFWHNPRDADALAVDDQWLWGEHVMFSPILTPSTTSRSVYIPDGIWLCWSGCPNPNPGLAATQPDPYPANAQGVKGPATTTIHEVTLEKTPVWFHYGAIIPLAMHRLLSQASPGVDEPRMVTAEEAVRKSPLHLVTLLATAADGDESEAGKACKRQRTSGDQLSYARGVYYWDRGDSMRDVAWSARMHACAVGSGKFGRVRSDNSFASEGSDGVKALWPPTCFVGKLSIYGIWGAHKQPPASIRNYINSQGAGHPSLSPVTLKTLETDTHIPRHIPRFNSTLGGAYDDTGNGDRFVVVVASPGVRWQVSTRFLGIGSQGELLVDMEAAGNSEIRGRPVGMGTYWCLSWYTIPASQVDPPYQAC